MRSFFAVFALLTLISLGFSNAINVSDDPAAVVITEPKEATTIFEGSSYTFKWQSETPVNARLDLVLVEKTGATQIIRTVNVNDVQTYPFTYFFKYDDDLLKHYKHYRFDVTVKNSDPPLTVHSPLVELRNINRTPLTFQWIAVVIGILVTIIILWAGKPKPVKNEGYDGGVSDQLLADH
ncbi:hypothetical protein PCE1_000171 [Barthelona sp. PCE]